MTATRTKPQRSLRVLGNPLPGLVRAELTVGRDVGVYTFARRTADVVGVFKAGSAEEYAVDGWNRTCTCPAGVHGNPCKHAAAVAKLERLGHL